MSFLCGVLREEFLRNTCDAFSLNILAMDDYKTQGEICSLEERLFQDMTGRYRSTYPHPSSD
jgi:hypothetical protein